MTTQRILISATAEHSAFVVSMLFFYFLVFFDTLQKGLAQLLEIDFQAPVIDFEGSIRGIMNH